jgi:quercetin dioxygenase-like cupin family protein
MFWMLCGFFLGCQSSKSSVVVPSIEVLNDDTGKLFPNKTVGISSASVLGYIDLREEFPVLEEPFFFRLRRLEISAGGTVAVHEHQDRPGVAYILSGSITEHRADDILIRDAGSHSFEYSGIRHGWENHTNQSVEAIVVDVLVPEKMPTIDTLPVQNPFSDTVPPKNALLTLQKKDASSLEQEGGVLADKSLRLRVVTLAPEGVVGAHKHDSRPSFAYVVSGNVLEHRGDGDYAHSSGSSVAERNGLAHWWENTGSVEATILVVDIVPRTP